MLPGAILFESTDVAWDFYLLLFTVAEHLQFSSFARSSVYIKLLKKQAFR